MKTKKTNQHTENLIKKVKETASKEGSGFWKRIGNELEKPRRKRREVNISSLERNTREGEIVLVPGKVLGEGELNHNLTVAALKFSEAAKTKIEKIMTIKELLEKNPKGKGVRIIG